MQPFVKYKMDKQRWALLYLLPIWMMAGGAVLIAPKDHRWVVTEWSQCSASCGGVKVRSIYCVNNYRLVSDGCQSEKPSSLVLCNLDKCQKPGLHLWLRSTRRKETSTVSSITTQTMASSNELQSAKQASTGLLGWTVSEWSECSATCGGGFRVRSVRCLDECGIISPKDERCNTSKVTRPSTYDFCAQIDCDTGLTDDNILPPNGTYSSSIPDGSFSVLDFTSTSIERYQVSHNVTETDGTLTILFETAIDGDGTFSCITSPVDIVITVAQPQGINVLFLNGESLFELDCVETTIVELGQAVTYDGNTVTVGGNEFTNITTFWYCDGFRCYMFNSSKSSFEMSGPRSKLFTSKSVALYSVAGLVNSDIEDILLNPPPIITSEPVATLSTLTQSASLMMTSTIVFTSSLSSVIPALTTSQVPVETSRSMSVPISTFSLPSSLLSPFALSTTLTTLSPSESIIPTPTGVTIMPTSVSIPVTPTATTPGRPSITAAIPSVTLTPTSTIGPDVVDPTRDETLCPRQTPTIKLKTRKRKKSRRYNKTRDTKKDTRDMTRTFKTKTKRRSKLQGSKKTKTKTKSYKMKSYTFERTECPPDKTTDSFTKENTRRRTTGKSKTRITSSKRTRSKSRSNTAQGSKTGGSTRSKSMASASPPQKTRDIFTKNTGRRTPRKSRITSSLKRIRSNASKMTRGSNTGSRTRVKSMESESWRKISLSKEGESRTWSKEKMKALIGKILFSELNWRFCSNLANLEEILSTNYNYKLQHHKTLKNLKTNEEKLFKELTCWRPHMDCIMLSERDLKSYPLQVLAECQHNEEKVHLLCIVHPEILEQLLQQKLAGYHNVFAEDLVYQLVLTACRNEDGRGWEEMRDMPQETVLCCIELECENSERDPT